MNIKKYLQLSDRNLEALEQKYNHIPKDYEIESYCNSIDKQCLIKTAKIAKLKQKNSNTLLHEEELKKARAAAIKNLFVKP